MWLTWYYLPGRPMANTNQYNHKALTVAVNKYKLGTNLMLTNTQNGRVVFVTVTDRTAHWVADANRIDATLLVWIKLGIPFHKGKVPIEVHALPNTQKSNSR